MILSVEKKRSTFLDQEIYRLLLVIYSLLLLGFKNKEETSFGLTFSVRFAFVCQLASRVLLFAQSVLVLACSLLCIRVRMATLGKEYFLRPGVSFWESGVQILQVSAFFGKCQMFFCRDLVSTYGCVKLCSLPANPKEFGRHMFRDDS